MFLTPPAVSLRAVEKTFRSPAGPVHAVRGVDIEIMPGEVVALLGPNGAGKSTTIDMLLGLTTPDGGTASLFGRPPTETVVASLYPRPLEVDEVLDLVGIERLAERRTQKLSGGETQRVRFALALVTDPDLLVLDEPTAAMDVEGRRDFWATIRAFAERGKTV